MRSYLCLSSCRDWYLQLWHGQSVQYLHHCSYSHLLWSRCSSRCSTGCPMAHALAHALSARCPRSRETACGRGASGLACARGSLLPTASSLHGAGEALFGERKTPNHAHASMYRLHSPLSVLQDQSTAPTTPIHHVRH